MATDNSMLVRLMPYDPKKGHVLKQYTYRGIRFQAGRGWYRVDANVAAYLERVRSIPGNENTPLAFEVRTQAEARALDERDRKARRRVVPAEEPLDVSRSPRAQPGVDDYGADYRDERRRRQRLSEWEERYDLRQEREEAGRADAGPDDGGEPAMRDADKAGQTAAEGVAHDNDEPPPNFDALWADDDQACEGEATEQSSEAPSSDDDAVSDATSAPDSSRGRRGRKRRA
ncbi:hypothetical protein [Haliangium sp.]|uniref:hypothetical protein n=1 Tax=Haliangium sp. TaxID=2663208 RepID=UPI003D12084B